MPPASGRSSKSSPVALKKAPTGTIGLDDITGGGLAVRRTTLVVGPSGAGKTVLAMQFVFHGATQRDEPGVYISFEGDARELALDFKSKGYDLDALAAADLVTRALELPNLTSVEQ